MRFLLLLLSLCSFAFGYAVEHFNAPSNTYVAPQEREVIYKVQDTYSHPLYKERKQRLLGVYGMYSKADSEAKLNIAGFGEQSHDLSEKQYGLGIQIGYLLSDNHRILANLEHHLKKNGFSYQLLTIGYAFTPQILNTNFRALLGINGGLALGKFNSGSFVIEDSAMGSLSYKGYTLGLKAGAIYDIGFGELEFGVQARRLYLGTEGSNVEIGGNANQVDLNLNQTSSLGAYVGYNFLF